jgi:hypothetical protein
MRMQHELMCGKFILATRIGCMVGLHLGSEHSADTQHQAPCSGSLVGSHDRSEPAADMRLPTLVFTTLLSAGYGNKPAVRERTRSSAASCASVSSGQQHTSWLSCASGTPAHIAACRTWLAAMLCGVALSVHMLSCNGPLLAAFITAGKLTCTGTGAASRTCQAKTPFQMALFVRARPSGGTCA